MDSGIERISRAHGHTAYFVAALEEGRPFQPELLLQRRHLPDVWSMRSLSMESRSDEHHYQTMQKSY